MMRLGLGLLAIVAITLPAAAQKKRTGPPPVIIQRVDPPAINMTPIEEKYGDWTAAGLGSGWAAFTKNESGSLFGVLCKDGCVAYLNAQTQCEEKGKYPALINASDGAFSVNLECVVYEKRYLLTTPLTETLVSSFEMGGELGIAFPLQSGKFQVTRFSLTGALKAANRVAAIADAAKTAKPSGKGLRDYSL